MLTRDALTALAVDGYFGNVGRRDIEAVMANFAEGSVMELPAMGVAYRGAAAIRAHFEDFFASYPAARFDGFRVTADAEGGSIAVRFVVTLTGPDGRELSMRNCNFFDLGEDGRFERVTIYTTASPDAGFTGGASAL